MEVQYRAMGGRVVVKVEGAGLKEVLKQIGPIAEILDADAACGRCNSENIYPSSRSVQGYDYYSLTCSACGAELSFGQRKDGGLWAKRTDEQKKPFEHRGWKVYERSAHHDGPRRSAGTTDDPGLTKLIESVKGKRGDDVENALADLYEAIGQSLGAEAAKKAWYEALRKFGDPQQKPDASVSVLRHLWGVLHG